MEAKEHDARGKHAWLVLVHAGVEREGLTKVVRYGLHVHHILKAFVGPEQLVLHLQLEQPSVQQHKVKRAWRFVFVVSGLANPRLFFEELLFGVLAEAQSLHASF